VKLFSVSQNAHCDNEVEKIINGFTFSPLTLGQLNIHTGLFTRGVLLNFYFAATNNTNGSNY
jgi:hypothetical protein